MAKCKCREENGSFRTFFAKLCTLCTFRGKFPISVVKSYFVEKYTAFRLMEQHADPIYIPVKRRVKKGGGRHEIKENMRDM